MKNKDILTRNRIASNIPLMIEGRKLSNEMQAKVMIMRVHYAKAAKQFADDMKEIFQGLKPEGFDEKSMSIMKMEEIDKRVKAAEEWKEGDTDKDGKPVEKPSMPSKEELEEADRARASKDEYEKQLAEINNAYNAAYMDKLEEDCGIGERIFTEGEFAELIGMMGIEGTMEITVDDNRQEVSKESFISMIAAWLVKE